MAGALAFGAQSDAQIPSTGVAVSVSFGSKSALDIQSVSQGSGVGALVSASSGNPGTPVPVAQVTIDLAPGYAASALAPGAQAGFAVLSASSGSGLSGAIALVSGELTADDPARYATDLAAQACAPGPYTAVWRFSASVLGLSYTLPIFVGHPTGDTQRVELRFCPPPLAGPDGKPVTTAPMPLTGAVFLLNGLAGPRARGTYTSSAYVTAAGATGAPDSSTTTEARFLDPVPHTLTLAGRYDAKTHSAVLTGRVTSLGKPEPGATVEYVRANSASQPRHVRTSRTGSFATRVRIAATTTFLAVVPDSTRSCAGPSAAPRGCASLTLAGTNARVVRVAVPRRRP